MYKVFIGEKCIMITDRVDDRENKSSKVIAFRSAEDLHREYRQFVRSSQMKNLIITGEKDIVWKVFRSLFTYIEAAGGAVRNEKGHLLMIYRNRHWDLPKGRIENGETPQQTALREVEEECGVKHLSINRELMKTHHIFFQDKKEWIKRTYWYDMRCNDTSVPTPQAQEGILKAEWLSKEEVKKLLNKVYPSLQEVLTKASFLS